MFKVGDILMTKRDNERIEIVNILEYIGQIWYNDHRNAKYLIRNLDSYNTGTMYNFTHDQLLDIVYTPEQTRNNTIDNILE